MYFFFYFFLCIATTQVVCNIPYLKYVHAFHQNKNEIEHIDEEELKPVIHKILQKKHQRIGVQDILNLHYALYKKNNLTQAGKFRNIGVKVNGVRPPAVSKVPTLMKKFIEWLHFTKKHAVYVAADAHLKLVHIHPFRDGNGRTARTLMALLLLREGYPVPTFIQNDRKFYSYHIHELDSGKTDSKKEYYRVIVRAIQRSMQHVKHKF